MQFCPGTISFRLHSENLGRRCRSPSQNCDEHASQKHKWHFFLSYILIPCPTGAKTLRGVVAPLSSNCDEHASQKNTSGIFPILSLFRAPLLRLVLGRTCLAGGWGWEGRFCQPLPNLQTRGCSEAGEAVIEISQWLILGKSKKKSKRSKPAQNQNRHHFLPYRLPK